MIDPGPTSRVGSLLTGSPHVVLERAGWTLPGRVLLPAGRAVVLGCSAVAVAGGGLVARALYRRRR